MMDAENINSGKFFSGTLEKSKKTMLDKSKMLFSKHADGESMIKGSGIGGIMNTGSKSPEYSDVSQYFKIGGSGDKVKNILGTFGSNNTHKMGKRGVAKKITGLNPTDKISRMMGTSVGHNPFNSIGKRKVPVQPHTLNKINMMLGTGTKRVGMNVSSPTDKINRMLGIGVPKVGMKVSSPTDKINRMLGIGVPKVGMKVSSPTDKISRMMGMSKRPNDKKILDIKNIMGTGFTRLKQQKGLSPFGDYDGDGVMNILDCNPLNKYKQGAFDENSNYEQEQQILYENASDEEGNTGRLFGEQMEGLKGAQDEGQEISETLAEQERMAEEEAKNADEEETTDETTDEEDTGEEPNNQYGYSTFTEAPKEKYKQYYQEPEINIDAGTYGFGETPKKQKTPQQERLEKIKTRGEIDSEILKNIKTQKDIDEELLKIEEDQKLKNPKVRDVLRGVLGIPSFSDIVKVQAAKAQGKSDYYSSGKVFEDKKELKKSKIDADAKVATARAIELARKDKESKNSTSKKKTAAEKMAESTAAVRLGVGGSAMRGTPMALGATELLTGVGSSGYGGVQKAAMIAGGGFQRTPWEYKVAQSIGGPRGFEQTPEADYSRNKLSLYFPKRSETPYSWKISEMLGNVRKEIKEPDVQQTTMEDTSMDNETPEGINVRRAYSVYSQPQAPPQAYAQGAQAPRPPTPKEIAEGKTNWSVNSQRYVKYTREPYDKNKGMGYPQPYQGQGQYPQQIPQGYPEQGYPMDYQGY